MNRFCRLGYALHQRASDAAAAVSMIKDADIADSKAIVSRFHRGLDKSEQPFALKRAERNREFQSVTEKHIVERLLN